MADMVNHPPHYTSHPSQVECIQVTEHMSFCLGNAVKYIWRCDQKHGLEDLKKASWYVNRADRMPTLGDDHKRHEQLGREALYRFLDAEPNPMIASTIAALWKAEFARNQIYRVQYLRDATEHLRDEIARREAAA